VVRTKGGKSHLRRRTSKRTKAQLSEMLEVKARKIIKRVKRLAPSME
jgi:large subunit ribosomal protein L35